MSLRPQFKNGVLKAAGVRRVTNRDKKREVILQSQAHLAEAVLLQMRVGSRQPHNLNKKVLLPRSLLHLRPAPFQPDVNCIVTKGPNPLL